MTNMLGEIPIKEISIVWPLAIIRVMGLAQTIIIPAHVTLLVYIIQLLPSKLFVWQHNCLEVRVYDNSSLVCVMVAYKGCLVKSSKKAIIMIRKLYQTL